MTEVKKRVKLPCTTCGGVTFSPVVEVERNPSGGMVEVPAGKMCTGCGTTLNARAAWTKILIDQQREKMRELQAQGELEMQGILGDSIRAAEEAGIGVESLLSQAQKGRRSVTREETELGKTLDSEDET